MKKIKSPWYGVIWILIWTAALGWFLASGRFTERESIGLILVWLTLVGTTVYLLVQYFRHAPKRVPKPSQEIPAEPFRNAPCPCGSGKKYKRCCGL